MLFMVCFWVTDSWRLKLAQFYLLQDGNYVNFL